MNGISSALNAAIGLPALSDSSSEISSAFDSIASASLSSAAARSPGVVVDQPFSNAARAAFTARSTSSAVDSGAWAIVSPVAGFRIGSVLPSAGATNDPLMKFLSSVAMTANLPPLPLRAYLPGGQA